MAKPQVLLLGDDLYAKGYVIKYPGIIEKKTFKKDKLIANTYEIDVYNEDDYFSINNNRSPFKNIDWLYSRLQVIGRQEETTWDGVLESIPRNHANKRAKLKTKNSLFKVRNEIIEYESSNWETGATSFKNVCDDVIGFGDYNKKSVEDSINQLTENNCYLKCNINKSDNMTFQKFIEKIAEYSNADAYGHLNEIYFIHWVPFSGGVKVNLLEKDLKTIPQVSEEEKEIINDYSIGYEGDNNILATDSNSNNIGSIARDRWGIKSLPEMRSSTGNQIIYENKVSAIYIGEGYIKRTIKDYSTNPQPLTNIKFDLFADHKDWIDLNTYFRLTLSDESWTRKIFEIFEFTIDEENDNINIKAYEVLT